ncbi:UNVERIFIED_CONTAM: Mitochondrial substrate carrier family protein B [Sesamum angustifolium]|uniref:Mitochondrial substrate carrier family protein B n=1 Tax=Sesamum angustifolium TaxID=2727405 RepID=A0AAW2LDZ6_9LAMI
MQTEARVGVVNTTSSVVVEPRRQRQIGTASQLLAGGVAGAVSKTCTAPLARLTILFQLLHDIVGVESQGENVSTEICIRLVGGGLAGVTAASVTYPLDLVRTRLATQGVGPNLAISFSVYETARSYWHFHRPEDSTVLVSLTCGSLSGIASSTVAYPLDLVRRRMQLEGAGGRARVYNTGLFGTFRHIIRSEGWRGLYRGILPEYYKEGSMSVNLATLANPCFWLWYPVASTFGTYTNDLGIGRRLLRKMGTSAGA